MCVKSYFLTEIVYFGIFYYHLEAGSRDVLLIVTTYALGYILGNIIINFSRISLKNGTILGFSLVFLAIILLILSPIYQKYSWGAIAYISLETLFSLGYGIFDPCIYAFIGKREHVHMRGKAFGLIDSSDNFSEFLVSIALVFSAVSFKGFFIIRIFSVILLIFALKAILSAFKKDSVTSDSF